MAISEEVTVDGAGGGGREWQEARFAAFATADDEFFLFGVNIGDEEIAQFRGTDAGIEEQHEDGAIAEGIRMLAGVGFLGRC